MFINSLHPLLQPIPYCFGIVGTYAELPYFSRIEHIYLFQYFTQRPNLINAYIVKAFTFCGKGINFSQKASIYENKINPE